MKKALSILMSIFYCLSAVESLANYNDLNNFPTHNISFGISYAKLVIENGEIPENISNILLLILLILVFGFLIASALIKGRFKLVGIIILSVMLLANLFTWLFHGLSETLYIWVILVAVNIFLIILNIFILKRER